MTLCLEERRILKWLEEKLRRERPKMTWRK